METHRGSAHDNKVKRHCKCSVPSFLVGPSPPCPLYPRARRGDPDFRCRPGMKTQNQTSSSHSKASTPTEREREVTQLIRRFKKSPEHNFQAIVR
ncbi:hypothetical protein NPIL_41481 [Nephila pilipes]|uniref:Uncharacterized protein n=1 Tax=Nephila pilipes TaxID=299642 RepID=A0A8X6Q5B5_NEPPI|nr:hypothetical protein NPIL_41481 [Nephila pilipes]